MGTLFPELGYRYRSALQWDWDDAVFALICVVIVELLWAVYESDTVQEIKFGIDQSVNNPYASGRMNLFLAAFECFLLCMAVSAAIYFSQRASYMLGRHGIAVSDAISSDLLHLHNAELSQGAAGNTDYRGMSGTCGETQISGCAEAAWGIGGGRDYFKLNTPQTINQPKKKWLIW